MTGDRREDPVYFPRLAPRESLAHLKAHRKGWILDGIPADAVDALIADAKKVIARERTEPEA